MPTHVEYNHCPYCKTGYKPTYIKRRDGFYDQVFTKCQYCRGTTQIKTEWSDTPFLDYFRTHGSILAQRGDK